MVINDFFDDKSSNKIKKKFGNFDLIYAANVYLIILMTHMNF